MKTALVILPACLLALVHLTSAQSEAPLNCESVRNLSPQCRRAFDQISESADQTIAFCSGNCFGPVLSAFESCESDQLAATFAETLRYGEKIMP